jgi:hypothetical protein
MFAFAPYLLVRFNLTHTVSGENESEIMKLVRSTKDAGGA